MHVDKRLQLQIGLSGSISLKSNGILVLEKSNIIVDAGLEKLSNTLAYGSPIVSHIALGDGLADTSTDPPTIQDPSASDTELVHEIIRKAVSATIMSNHAVRFSITLENNEGNGSGTVNYSEAGLFLSDGTMLSHVSFYPQTKSSENQLIFEWDISFARQGGQ